MRFFWQGPSRSLLAVAVAVGASSVWVSGVLIYDPLGALADWCGPVAMGAIRPINVKVIIWSATTRAAPISFFMPTVCRIIFLMFLPNYCEGEFESRSPGVR